MVYVYDAENAMTLDVMAKSLSSQKGSAVRRSGKRLVWIYTFPADADLADDLADDLGL
jgi:hypothetical protein